LDAPCGLAGIAESVFNLEVHAVDPKKKNIIYVAVIVVGLGAAAYTFLFSGGGTTAQSQTGTFVKKTHAPVDGLVKGEVIKKEREEGSTKKAEFVKKEAPERGRDTLKKRAGQRGNRNTKKKEIVPAA
jgi:hypothetical protein